MESLLQDLRFGTRILRRSPGITAAVILALVLGIGANSAMFSVVDGLLLHPVRFQDPASLVFVWERDPQGAINSASAADFLDWRTQARSFSDLTAWVATNFVVTGGDRPQQVAGARVTANFFRTLDVKPLLGRTFLPDEDGLQNPAAAARVVVIGYRLWQENLGADPNVLGRAIQLNSVPYAIVGVMPPGFQFWWRQHQVWLPVSVNPQDRDYHYLVTVGRLKTARARASAEMTVLARTLERAYPKSNKGWTVQVDDLQESMVARSLRTRLLLLFGAVGLVLLIACANVASLLLTRSVARSREVAVRISMGATRWRLARQLLTESLLLSSIGGALGLLLAWALIRAAPRLIPPDIIPAGAPLELSLSVVGFTALVAALTGILFGLAPALSAVRPDVQATLREVSRGSTASRGRHRFREAMVTAEVAAALMLVTSAGLMIQSLRKLGELDLGCDPRQVLTLRLFLPPAKYDAAQALRFHRNALQRIAALPGVTNVTVASALPLLNLTMEAPFDLEGSGRDINERPGLGYLTIGTDYFRTLGIPLKRGRSFTESDNESAPPVVIVNEALAARYFPNQDPLGQHVLLNRPMRGRNQFDETVHPEIVGIVGNVRLADLFAGPRPLVYAPHPQNVFAPTVWFALRTRYDPAGLTAAVRRELIQIDPEQPIDQVESLEQTLADRYAEPRFETELMGSFAGLALALAVLGIYGVHAYAVAQRRHEFGVRMALGANAGAVLRGIVGQGMRLTGIGIAIGLAGALALRSVLQSVLFGVSAADPIMLLAAALLLAIVALVACYLPARQASRINPAIALRLE